MSASTSCALSHEQENDRQDGQLVQEAWMQTEKGGKVREVETSPATQGRVDKGLKERENWHSGRGH